MPVYQEKIFHDRQIVGSTTPFATTSTSFVDIPGAVITTKDLSQGANYLSSAALLVSGSLNNTTATFRGILDGVPFGAEVPITLRSKDSDVGYTLLGLSSDVQAGSAIKLQCKTDIGTLTIVEYAISVDGIPQSRVI